MNVDVYCDGQKGGTVPYTALPAFRLFCKQNGFRIKWDQARQRIDLESGLQGKVCALVIGRRTAGAPLQEIVGKVEAFLTEYGVRVVLVEKRADLPQLRDVAVRLLVKEEQTAARPHLELVYSAEERQRNLLNCLHVELKNTQISCIRKARKEVRPQQPFLTLQLILPKSMDEDQLAEAVEKISFYLASGILRYFHSVYRITHLSYAHRYLLNAFFSQVEVKVEDAPIQQMEKSILPSTELSEAIEEQRSEAEVFFDYTLFHSEAENRPFLLSGHLYVKNTGNQDLYNPIVCLKVTPLDSIRLGGQILPPNLVETMAVQGSSGMKGWRYLDDDWFQQAQERGEYWIAPIQSLKIGPRETESFQNFQMSIKKPEQGNNVMVEAVVLFREQGLHFPANNRIALSF